jgi:hypothetical protein
MEKNGKIILINPIPAIRGKQTSIRNSCDSSECGDRSKSNDIRLVPRHLSKTKLQEIA